MQESSVEVVFVVGEGKIQENRCKGKNDQRRLNEWTGAERICQPHEEQVIKCLERVGVGLPRRRSRDSGSRVHHPLGRRSDRLQTEVGKRQHSVARRWIP
jgi:hypothetical protein